MSYSQAQQPAEALSPYKTELKFNFQQHRKQNAPLL